MASIWKTVLLACALCLAGLGAGNAEARVVVGVGIGFPLYGPAYWGPYPYGYYNPYVAYPAPRVIVAQPAPAPAPAAAPDPIFYPTSGQSPAQVETDRRGCNRWATTQPGSMADASIFQRATYACMEGRGYTVR
jgi:hypothetical protein